MKGFPRQDIDPKKKDQAWHLQFAKAAWDEYTQLNMKMFYGARDKYNEIADYVQGRQSSDNYKKQVLNSEVTDESWVLINWKIRHVSQKLRDIGIEKLEKRDYNIIASLIDLTAKDETETYYNKMKTRLQMREEMMRVNPELAQLPAMAKETGDPESVEEREMMIKYGGMKLKAAMEAEMGIEYVLHNSNFREMLTARRKNLWDYGVAVEKEYVEQDGEPRCRSVYPGCFIISPVSRQDFSDARYMGELREMFVGELPFDAEDRYKIAQGVRNKSYIWSNRADGQVWDNEKIEVLDIEFMCDDEVVYKRYEDRAGNEVYRRGKFEKRNSKATVNIKGIPVPKYEAKPVRVLRRAKWVVGTDYIFDFGPAEYQKRNPSNKSLTSYSYHIRATNFDKMQCTGMQERLNPLIDEYHTTIFKIQQFKTKWIPYIINIDIQAMESVALGKGGGNMTPKEILELVFQNFTALGRRMDVSGNLQNYKMVDVEGTGMAQEYAALAGDLARILGDMRDFVGLNDLTDGSTPGERTLNYVASLGAEATNNALAPMMRADKAMTESLARGIILRLVQVVQKKDISGIIRTLGSETVKFIRVTKDIVGRMYDIKIEDRPTDAERQMLMQDLIGKEANGLITPADKLLIMEATNLHQLRAILSLRISKREKDLQAQKLSEMQMNGKVQQDSAKMSEEEKRKTLRLEYQLKTQLEEYLLDKQILLQEKKNEGLRHQSDTSAASKILTESMKSDAQASQMADQAA